MKKFLICLFGVLFITGAYANTDAVRVFVGGNFSVTDAVWTDEGKQNAQDIFGTKDMPKFHAGIGGVIGARYATRDIYNVGASLSYDYMLNSKKELNVATGYYNYSTGFSAIGLTFDNYIRLFKQTYKENRRGDLLFGIGPARVTARAKADTIIGKVSSDDYDYGMVIKLGYNGQIDQDWDWFVHARWFFVPGNDNDVNSLLNLSVGVTYNF